MSLASLGRRLPLLLLPLLVLNLLVLLPGLTEAQDPLPGRAALPQSDQTITITRGRQTITMRPIKTVVAPDGREAVAGRLLVGFKAGVSGAERLDIHRRAGGQGAVGAQAVAALGANAHVVSLADATALDAAIRAYTADARVRYAEPDYIARTTGTPNDPRFGELWGMTKIEAPASWDRQTGSPTIKVAVLDTGIYEVGASQPNGYPGHPDLNGKVVARADFTGSSTGSDDYQGHGTHVAGTVAAAGNNGIGVAGVAYNVSLMNAKVLGDNGSGSISGIADGIRWAADNGAHVINMSLGATGACAQAYQEAIDYAWARNVVIIAAAGNDGVNTLAQPASCNNVVAVAATTATDAKAGFSNHGSAWVDVAAPGDAILSTSYTGGYVEKNGTSMAAPHVAGLAGLLWSTGAYSSNGQIVARITGTADAIAGTGSLWQHGRINANRAVPVVSAPPTATPTSTPPPTVTPIPPTTEGALTWYFAEGFTGDGFHEYLTIMNPNGTAAAVTITYYLGDGSTVVKSLTVAANSRSTVAVHDAALGVGRGREVGAKVASTNGVGLIVERPMYFIYNGQTGGHNVLGATALKTTFYFAEGYTGDGFDQYLTILNPTGSDASVRITYYLGPGKGGPVTKDIVAPAGRRVTVAVHGQAQGVGRGQEVSTKVQSTNGVGLVVERPMYFTYFGVVDGGHNVIGYTP